MAVNVLLEMERIMAEQNYVELRHVNKKYKDFQASDDINFGIGKGKLIGLLGPSGSGKTTILRMLAGLEHADSGRSSLMEESSMMYRRVSAGSDLCFRTMRCSAT
mgnify:CR=1 FL=1